MTALAAISGMIVGAITVLVWSKFNGGLFDLYALAPGFVFASLVIVLITQLKPAKNKRALKQFENVEKLLHNNII